MELSSEDKLKAIIEAQVKGGYSMYEMIIKLDFIITSCHHIVLHKNFDRLPFVPVHILEILLDTEGCKAAYGEERESVMMGVVPVMNIPKWEVAVKDIHWAWHSEEGNNWKKAIDTAYSLLPND